MVTDVFKAHSVFLFKAIVMLENTKDWSRCWWSVRSYAAITAGLQLLPEGLHLSQFHLVKGDWHLSNGIIPTEAIVVQHLKVQSALSNLLIRKA